MYCQKCGKELGDESKFCNHCGAVQGVWKKKPNIKVLLVAFIALVIVISGLFFLLKSDGSIRVPKELNEQSQAELSNEEQNILNEFIQELVQSFNNGQEENNYFQKTDNFDESFSAIKAAANKNDYLNAASTKGFLIVMESSMGAITPGESSSPEEMKQDIEEMIKEIINEYYN